MLRSAGVSVIGIPRLAGAVAVTINPGPIATSISTYLYTDHHGHLLTTHYPAGQVFNSITVKISSSTAVTIFTSAGASTQLWTTQLMATNAGGASTWVYLLDGAT